MNTFKLEFAWAHYFPFKVTKEITVDEVASRGPGKGSLLLFKR